VLLLLRRLYACDSSDTGAVTAASSAVGALAILLILVLLLLRRMYACDSSDTGAGTAASFAVGMLATLLILLRLLLCRLLLARLRFVWCWYF
jgi:hypothetical protein